MKCGVGGSHSSSEEESSSDEDDPEDEFLQNFHPAQVELERVEPAVEDLDEPLVVEDELEEELEDEVEVFEEWEPLRCLLRRTFRRACLTLERADLLDLPVLPDATDSARFLRLLRCFGAGVYSGCGFRLSRVWRWRPKRRPGKLSSSV